MGSSPILGTNIKIKVIIKMITKEEAWKTYNFINDYKNGKFGLITLTEALNKYYDNYNQNEPLKNQIGDTV